MLVGGSCAAEANQLDRPRPLSEVNTTRAARAPAPCTDDVVVVSLACCAAKIRRRGATWSQDSRPMARIDHRSDVPRDRLFARLCGCRRDGAVSLGSGRGSAVTPGIGDARLPAGRGPPPPPIWRAIDRLPRAGRVSHAESEEQQRPLRSATHSFSPAAAESSSHARDRHHRLTSWRSRASSRTFRRRSGGASSSLGSDPAHRSRRAREISGTSPCGSCRAVAEGRRPPPRAAASLRLRRRVVMMRWTARARRSRPARGRDAAG